MLGLYALVKNVLESQGSSLVSYVMEKEPQLLALKEKSHVR